MTNPSGINAVRQAGQRAGGEVNPATLWTAATHQELAEKFGRPGMTVGEAISLVQRVLPKGLGSGGTLNGLSFEEAQMVLEARGEAIQEFLDSWSESIADQAKKDKKSARLAQRMTRMVPVSVDHRRLI